MVSNLIPLSPRELPALSLDINEGGLSLIVSLTERVGNHPFCVVLNRLREQLTARGSTTIRGLGRSFKLFDSYDGNRKVDGQEFFVGL